MKKYNYLVIEGNIGAGKTSLATRFAGKYDARLILEQYSDNPFLPKFYQDPSRYAFPLELSFLAARYNQLHRELASSDLFRTFTIADYLFGKSLIFSRITLKTDELKLYLTLFDIIQRQLPKPDLCVYLHVTVDRLLENIRKRGRDYEGDIRPEYLESLQEGYLAYFRSLTRQKILILDVNDLDFVSNERDFETIERAVFEGDYQPGLNRVVLS